MRTLVTVLLLLLVAALPVVAAQDPVLRRGFNPDAVYSFGDVDAVDVFSGNLTVNIPLGQKYSSNGSLAYQFRLTHNSNFWDYYEQHTVDFVAQYKLHYDSYMGLNDWAADAPASAEGTEALPGRMFNSGLGWRMSLGDMYGGFLSPNALTVRYVDESGAEHAFFPQLHGVPASGLSEVLTDSTKPAYTRDGTYLRLRRVDSGNVVKVAIDFPDGLTKTFSCVDCPGGGALSQWNLDEIRDPFGNTLTVTRSCPNVSDCRARPAVGSTWTWTFTERNETGETVRAHEAEFYVANEWKAAGTNVPVAWEVQLNTLKLAVCCNDNEGTYTFTYTQQDIFRPSQSNWLVANKYMAIPYNNNSGSAAYGSIRLSVLQAVTLPAARRPDGTSVQPGAWSFNYLLSPSEIQLQNRTNLYPASDYSGRLARLFYPTGGGLEYSYASRNFIKTACLERVGAARSHYQKLVGISRRQPITYTGAREGKPWIYTGRKYFPTSGDCIDTTDFTATVIDPLGKATVSYFSIAITDIGDWKGNEYGLPVSKYDADRDPVTNEPLRWITSEVYDCSQAGLHALPSGDDDYNPLTPSPLFSAIRDITPRYRRSAAPPCTGPLRKTYVQYENSGTYCDPANDLGDCSHANRRLSSMKTVYQDYCTADPRYSRASAAYCDVVAGTTDVRYQLTDLTDYDGLGHYRTNTRSGNLYARAFPSQTSPALDTLRQVTWFNPGVSFNGTVTGRDLASTATPWVLDTYSFTKSTFGSATAYTLYSFDETTGFLAGYRKLKNFGPNDAASATGTVNAADVLVRQSRSNAYDSVLARNVTVVDQRYYGGDDRPVLQANSLTATLTFQPEYWIRSVYLGGTLARRSYLPRDTSNPSTACPVLITEDNRIDVPSGLVTSSADEWAAEKNLPATYDYDALGRFISVKPPGEAAMQIIYPSLLQPGATSTILTRRTSASAGTDQQGYQFDSRGRLIARQHWYDKAPNDSPSHVDIDYGDDQLVSQESNENEANQAGNRNYTTYVHDVFGRRLVVSPPGVEDRKVYATYFGVQRVETQTNGIASGGIGATIKSLTTRHSDSLGRLIKVDEPGSIVTTYAYDMENRLVSVSGGSQARTFTYDGRGFLIAEHPPELATYDLKYEKIDSRGNVRLRSYRNATSSATAFDLEFSFDEAERMTAVIQPSPERRVLKTFGYDHGKLIRATRTNWVPPPISNRTSENSYAVTDAMSYYDNGKLQTKTTSAGFNATTTLAWNDLGELVSLQYPQVSDYCAGACGAIGSSRTVTYGYVNASLETVNAGAIPLITKITYHPNGLWHEVDRGNGAVDWQTIENDYARPASLRTVALTQLGRNINAWLSGDMKYDGFGSIASLDTDTFNYDALGRLQSAIVGDPDRNSTAVVRQNFVYDRWGNMTEMRTNGTPMAFTVNGSTNRISSMQYGSASNTPVYDLAGNLRVWTDPRRPGFEAHVDYDPFELATQAFVKGPDPRREFGRVYLYDAMDERVAILDYSLNESNPPNLRETWSFRGALNEVLRDAVHELRTVNGAKTWSWRAGRDYAYRQGKLIAEIVPSDPVAGTTELTRHMHLDHLGSVRAVTGNAGRILEQRKYLPFGEQMVASGNPSTRMAFAGHERDDDQTGNPYADLDYMHARYYASMLGRFLSVDPLQGKAANPQSWNRYAYVRNNPLSLVDRDGRQTVSEIYFEQEMRAYMDGKISIEQVRENQKARAVGAAIGLSIVLAPQAAARGFSALDAARVPLAEGINNWVAGISLTTTPGLGGAGIAEGSHGLGKIAFLTLGGAAVGYVDSASDDQNTLCGAFAGGVAGFLGASYSLPEGIIANILGTGIADWSLDEFCEWLVERAFNDPSSSGQAQNPPAQPQTQAAPRSPSPQ